MWNLCWVMWDFSFQCKDSLGAARGLICSMVCGISVPWPGVKPLPTATLSSGLSCPSWLSGAQAVGCSPFLSCLWWDQLYLKSLFCKVMPETEICSQLSWPPPPQQDWVTAVVQSCSFVLPDIYRSSFRILLFNKNFAVAVVQSLSLVWFFVISWTAARQASLSFTISRSLLKLMSTELVMPSNHLICCPLLLLPSVFPSIRVFSNELAVYIRWPKYWSFSLSISPSKE